jgi:hypothetical protein
MHVCPYGAMAIFILNKISLLEPKTQNRVRSAYKSFLQRISFAGKCRRLIGLGSPKQANSNNPDKSPQRARDE